MRTLTKSLLIFAALLAGAAFAGGPVDEPPTLRIYHVDIGQGDATIIVGPGDTSERKVMLVDAGDPLHGNLNGGKRVLDALGQIGATRLDYVLATHYDYDHIGGLAMGKGDEHSVLLGPDNAPGKAGVDDDGDGVADWMNRKEAKPDRDEMGRGDDLYARGTQFIDHGEAAERASATTRRYWSLINPQRRFKAEGPAQLGKRFSLGGGASAMVVCGSGYVLDHAARIRGADSANELSTGVLVTFGKFDYLVCGDLIGQRAGSENAKLETALGQALVGRGHSVEALHVNHHGAPNATAPEFIQTIKPIAAFISVGQGYGHPAAKALDALFENGAAVYQTEAGARSSTPAGAATVLGGHILVESTGQQFRVRNWGSLGTVQVEREHPVHGARPSP